VTCTVEFAPTGAVRNKFRMRIGATLCVGLASIIAVVHALHVSMNDVVEIASVRNRMTVPPSVSASSFDVGSASVSRGGAPADEPASIFSDRFAFGGAEDTGDRTHSGPPVTERFPLHSARPHHHSGYRHKMTRRGSGRAAGSHGWFYEFLNLSRFEPSVPDDARTGGTDSIHGIAFAA